MDLPAAVREQLLVHEQTPLGPLTTLGVGGPAPWVLEPRSREELLLAVTELAAAGLPWRMLGHGSNLLIGDAGVPEIVIRTSRMDGIWHHGKREHALRVAAGTSLARLVSVAQKQGLAGAEALIGIPGTLGGAVAGNAGSRHGSIGDVLVSVTVVQRDGSVQERACTPADFGYRSSPFRGEVVLDAVLQLRPEAPAAIRARLAAILAAKRESQPLTAASAGCIFRNSADAPSGRRIEQAGCKGLSVGGAIVSERHANFIVNTGGARAADVLELVAAVQQRVAEQGGPPLVLEVELWGVDPPGAAAAAARAPSARGG